MRRDEPREAVDNLSERELLVARLNRSPATIRNQISAIFAKLNINSVAMIAPLLAARSAIG